MKIRKWWLEAALISGAEGEGDTGGDTGGDGGTGGTSGDQNQGQQNNDGDGGDGDAGDDNKETYSKEDVENLRKALKSEREQRRLLQKAQRDAATKQQQDADKAKDDAAAKALADATARLDKLAEGYRTSRVEQAVIAAARVERAIAPEDVYAILAASKFDGIDIEQDPDDPTKVTVDADDLKKAVKAVLKSRPHWVQAPGDGQPSGGQFPPGGKKGEADDAALKAMYPFLANRL